MQRKKFFIGLLSGFLLALSFPPYPFFPFAFIGLVPLLYVFNSVKRRWLLTYLVFFVYHYATNWWISSWQKDTDPYLFVSGFAVALVHPFFFMIPFALLNLIQKKYPRRISLWLFPFLWLAFEWFHSLGDLAYPWLTLGYTQAYNHFWIQIADIGGVWLLSFLIVLANVLILFFVEDVQENRLRKFGKIALNKYLVAFALVLIVPSVYGVFRSMDFDPSKLLKQQDVVKVGIVQPNINPWRKWDTSPESQIAIHLKIQDSLKRANSDIDLFVWSETAVTFLSLDVNAYHDFSEFYRFLERKFAILTGFADFRFLSSDEKPSFTTKFYLGDSSRPYNTYNSILLLNPDHSYQVYHKIRLTPFGEQIPYGEIFGFARSFLEWNVGISSWAKGNEQNNLRVKTQRKNFLVAPIICIESIYPGFCREFVHRGASLMVIITNDGWYDHTFGPLQHYLIATFRAIENRRFIVRCANTGISGFICPNGESLARAPQYRQIGIAENVPLLSNQTIYTLYGDWIAYLAVAVALASITFTFFLRPKGAMAESHKRK